MKRILVIAILAIVATFVSFIGIAQAETMYLKEVACTTFIKEMKTNVCFAYLANQPNSAGIYDSALEFNEGGCADPQRTSAMSKSFVANGEKVQRLALYVPRLDKCFSQTFDGTPIQTVNDNVRLGNQYAADTNATAHEIQDSATLVAACKSRVNAKYRKTFNSGTTYDFAHAIAAATCKSSSWCPYVVAGSEFKADMQDRKWAMAIVDCESNPGPMTGNEQMYAGAPTTPPPYYSAPAAPIYYPPAPNYGSGYGYEYPPYPQTQRAPGSRHIFMNNCMQRFNDSDYCHYAYEYNR
ncbi:MAG: hypothetical protein PHU42_02070 [Patescibacteria group bacterium]|nr:hypothetical protein [Patescibacteria group bacterium]